MGQELRNAFIIIHMTCALNCKEKAMFPEQCGSFGSDLIPHERVDFPIDVLNSIGIRSIHKAYCKKLHKVADINHHKSNMAPLSMDPLT